MFIKKEASPAQLTSLLQFVFNADKNAVFASDLGWAKIPGQNSTFFDKVPYVTVKKIEVRDNNFMYTIEVRDSFGSEGLRAPLPRKYFSRLHKYIS